MMRIRPELRKEFKGHSVPPEIIMMFVYMKLRFSLSYRDLEEMMNLRGSSIDHSTVQRWIIRFTPLLEREVRKRKKPTGGSWRMGETYVKLKGTGSICIEQLIQKEIQWISYFVQNEIKQQPVLSLERPSRTMGDLKKLILIKAEATLRGIVKLT